MMNTGRFVVLEGIDGAGTTTQTQRLVEHLRRNGEAVCATREPSDGPIGAFIRQVLAGRIVAPGGIAPTWRTMALLFAADRMDHLETKIEPVLRQGGVVVSDRYDASSLAYQSISSDREEDTALEWIRQLNSQALRPELTIVLDVPADEAAVRRHARGEPAQLYERSDAQRRLAAFYRDLPRHMPGDSIVVLDGSGSVEDVHARVVGAYRALFS